MTPIYPDIPKFTTPRRDPVELSVVQHWGFFSRDELTQSPGRLMMLDIDFGRECSLRCPTCFRRRNAVDDSADPDLSYDELLDVLRQARELGLTSVKICGAGEPFENQDLLRLARTLTDWDVGLSIFTKGHVLGDDGLAERVFAHEGVQGSRALAQRLFELKTSVLLSFQSFRPEIQDRLVGNVDGHTIRRNRAAELLCDVGFNRSTPTRLAFCANPITQENYDELFDIYIYCRERHILPVIAALMVSGKQFSRRFLDRVDVSPEQKLELWARIYRYNLDYGIQSADDLVRDGVSSMPGIHPCNQIAVGLYVTLNGNVTMCPGDANHLLGNIHKDALADIWAAASPHRGQFNCGCPPKCATTLPSQLLSRTRDYLGACPIIAPPSQP